MAKYLTRIELAIAIGKSTATIQRWHRTGIMPIRVFRSPRKRKALYLSTDVATLMQWLRDIPAIPNDEPEGLPDEEGDIP